MREKRSCPSAPIKKGHFLIGKFEDTHLKFNVSKTEIDTDILAEIKEAGKENYRASMDCVTSKCLNWNGTKCIVTEHVASYFTVLKEEEYKNCSIRDTCRWFYKDREKACQMCPLIKTQFIIE